MHEITLEAEVRTDRGKQTRRLRRQGKVPGIFYVHGEENITLAVPERSLHQLIHAAETHIINLKIGDGTTKSCILRDIQFDPVTERPLHVDFQGVRADEKVTVEVPIIIVGVIPQGVRDGGILQHIMHRLRISCLPKDIPDHVEVNAEGLAINHSIHVRDLKVENVMILESPDNTVVAVIPPTVEKVAEAGAVVEEIAEPEVIGKGKKEEGEGEGEEPAKGEAKTEGKAEGKAGSKKEAKTETAAKGEAPKKDEKKKEVKK